MGLDVGDVRTGVALSDPSGSIASPLKIIQSTGRERKISEIITLVKKHQVGKVVVGLPVSLSGEIGPQARKVEEFCAALGPRLGIPLVRFDESFSSVAADKIMHETGVSRASRKTRRDAVAAAVILQGYLDSQQRESVHTSSLEG